MSLHCIYPAFTLTNISLEEEFVLFPATNNFLIQFWWEAEKSTSLIFVECKNIGLYLLLPLIKSESLSLFSCNLMSQIKKII